MPNIRRDARPDRSTQGSNASRQWRSRTSGSGVFYWQASYAENYQPIRSSQQFDFTAGGGLRQGDSSYECFVKRIVE